MVEGEVLLLEIREQDAHLVPEACREKGALLITKLQICLQPRRQHPLWGPQKQGCTQPGPAVAQTTARSPTHSRPAVGSPAETATRTKETPTLTQVALLQAPSASTSRVRALQIGA